MKGAPLRSKAPDYRATWVKSPNAAGSVRRYWATGSHPHHLVEHPQLTDAERAAARAGRAAALTIDNLEVHGDDADPSRS